jgi:hypothetical protein
MKNLMMIIIIVLTFNYVFCQVSKDTIPNASFENWNSMGWFENPEGWQTNNSQLMEYVVKDSNANQGNLAMRINTNGWAQIQLPIIYCSYKDVGDLFFHIKTHNQDSDRFSVEVYYLFKSKIIDTGLCEINTNLNVFTLLKTSAANHSSSNVDSISIIIRGGSKPDNYVILDNLWVMNVWLNIKPNNISQQPWKIFSQDHSLQFKPINSKNESVISIISVTGQIIYTKITRTQPISIPLNPGIYFYRITQNNLQIQSGKVVVI